MFKQIVVLLVGVVVVLVSIYVESFFTPRVLALHFPPRAFSAFRTLRDDFHFKSAAVVVVAAAIVAIVPGLLGWHRH